jgi:hypothetical protein
MARSGGRFICLLLLLGVFVAGISRFSAAAQGVVQQSSPLPKIRYEGVTSMGLLAPRAGWAMLGGRLVSTNDNGGTWVDITPPGLTATMLDRDNVLSFLDARRIWVVIVDRSRTWDWFSGAPMRIVMTRDGGRTWHSHKFDEAHFPDLKQAGAFPISLSFVDSSHGWFLWRCHTSAAFSLGKLLRTDDGGYTWTELPDPPSAGELRFHTPQDGWIVVGAGSEKLSVTHNGGKTWQPKLVPPPTNCLQCRPGFSAPRFQNPSQAAMAVTYVEYNAGEGREVNSTYVTHDSGNTWQVTEAYEQAGPYPKTGFVSIAAMHAIRVFSDAIQGVQIRTLAGATNSSYSSFPKELPLRGFVTAADFADDSNGWLLYQAYACNKFRSPATDGPGLPCVNGVRQADLLTTTDGGKTFRVITPSASPVPSQ